MGLFCFLWYEQSYFMPSHSETLATHGNMVTAQLSVWRLRKCFMLYKKMGFLHIYLKPLGAPCHGITRFIATS